MPADHVPVLFLPGVLRSIWGGPVRLLADELGVELDEITERVERWEASEPIDCTMIRVEPGEVAAVRFAVEGIVDGRAVITMEHVNRLTAGAAHCGLSRPMGAPACIGSRCPVARGSRSTPMSVSKERTTTRRALSPRP